MRALLNIPVMRCCGADMAYKTNAEVTVPCFRTSSLFHDVPSSSVSTVSAVDRSSYDDFLSVEVRLRQRRRRAGQQLPGPEQRSEVRYFCRATQRIHSASYDEYVSPLILLLLLLQLPFIWPLTKHNSVHIIGLKHI